MKGIDVSAHQGLIDWAKAAADGVSFVIARAGYGKYASQADPTFQQNIFGALSAGIHAGAYWFSYALTPDDARKEARLCAQVFP